MVDITNLANMFSQKTGAQSSMATMVINAVIGYMMQRGLGGMMSGGGIMSALSNFMGGDNTSPNSDMVKHVQQTCGIQDPQQASQYTQEAVNMNEHGNTNPSGLESLLSNFMGGGQSQSTSTGQQQPQKKKGLLDHVIGSLGV